MKTTILPCLQQFSSKNSKNVYHDQFLKSENYSASAKLCKTFVLALNNKFYDTAILQCLQQFSSKNSKNVYHDQFLKSENYSASAKLCKTFVLASKYTFYENCYFAVFAAVFQ